jgi:hypothetical protein
MSSAYKKALEKKKTAEQSISILLNFSVSEVGNSLIMLNTLFRVRSTG